MPAVSTATTVGELVVDDPARARVFEQLGLDYCCGGKRPLAEACRERGLDPDTVAAMLNAAEASGVRTGEDWSQATLAELCDHIVEAHHGFLRRELPRLSTLLEKVASRQARVAQPRTRSGPSSPPAAASTRAPAAARSSRRGSRLSSPSTRRRARTSIG
jgi:iron-sulfur cluster repair protein YtfE (RIC family)